MSVTIETAEIMMAEEEQPPEPMSESEFPKLAWYSMPSGTYRVVSGLLYCPKTSKTAPIVSWMRTL